MSTQLNASDDSIQLSIVVPAYNEAARLPPYLASIRSYCCRVFGGRYEVIIVDDGSTDGMHEILHSISRDWRELAVYRLGFNQGKGRALRHGLARAQGRWVLYADADGATAIEEEAKLRRALVAGADVAIGSRLVVESTVSRTRQPHRAVIGFAFSRLVQVVCRMPIHDTQCGFKMFLAEPARRLAGLCQENGYLLDVEILALAHLLRYRIAEIPVSWTDVPGSKVRMIRDSWGMFCGLWKIRKGVRDLSAIDDLSRPGCCELAGNGVSSQGPPLPIARLGDD